MPLLLSSSSKQKCYAVVRGKVPGIYRSWEECSAQVTGWPNALFKSFRTEQEARNYVCQHTLEKTIHEDKNIVNNLKRSREARTQMLETKTISRGCSGIETEQSTVHTFAPVNCTNRQIEKLTIVVPNKNEEEEQCNKEGWCKMYNSLLEKSNIVIQEVYVDGACRANGMAHRACAGYGGFYGSDDDTRNFALALPANESQTNNRGELRAVIHAIEQAFKDALVSTSQPAQIPLSQCTNEFKIFPQQHKMTKLDEVNNEKSEIKDGMSSHSEFDEKPFMKARNIVSGTGKTIAAFAAKRYVYYLRIFSDSKYVVDGLDKFSKRWVKNGFKLVNGKKVQNEDLWKQLIKLRNEYNNLFVRCNGVELQHIYREMYKGLSECDVNRLSLFAQGVELVHVRGHNNVPGNVKADALAVQGATMHNEKTETQRIGEQHTEKNPTPISITQSNFSSLL